MWRGVLGNLGLGAAGLVVALLAAELCLRVVGLGDPVLYDNRTAWGYRPLPNQTRRRIAQARVHVNQLGVRGPDVAEHREPGVERLLFLGDSVTWGGSYVDDAHLFGAVAADLLGAQTGVRTEALVAGVNAWGPANILGLVRATGGFDSTIWVLTMLEDDFRRDKTRIAETPYFNVSPRLALEEGLVYGAYRVLGWYRVPRPAEDLERVGRRNLARVAAIAQAGRDAGARLLLVWHQTEGPCFYGEPEPHREPYLALGARIDAPTVDLCAVYRGSRSDPYEDGMHLTVAGHQVAGQAIGEALVRMLRAPR